MVSVGIAFATIKDAAAEPSVPPAYVLLLNAAATFAFVAALPTSFRSNRASPKDASAAAEWTARCPPSDACDRVESCTTECALIELFPLAGRRNHYWLTSHRDSSMMTAHPLPWGQTFFVRIERITHRATLAIGLARFPYNPDRLPGWNYDSIAVHSDDGHLFHNDNEDGIHFAKRPLRAGDEIKWRIDKYNNFVVTLNDDVGLQMTIPIASKSTAKTVASSSRTLQSKKCRPVFYPIVGVHGGTCSFMAMVTCSSTNRETLLN